MADEQRRLNPTDQVRQRRAVVARWTLLANRVGYLVLALAVATFIIAFAIGFSSTLATTVVVCLIKLTRFLWKKFAMSLPNFVSAAK